MYLNESVALPPSPPYILVCNTLVMILKAYDGLVFHSTEKFEGKAPVTKKTFHFFSFTKLRVLTRTFIKKKNRKGSSDDDSFQVPPPPLRK